MTLENLAIVYFGNDWFAENRTSSHHIARRLSQRCPVLYVETPGMRAPTATKRDLRKLSNKLKRAWMPPRLVQRNLWVLTVPQIPFRRIPFVQQLNRSYGRFMVQLAARKLGFSRVIVWFTVPHTGQLAGQLDEDFVVYYCVDDYSQLPGVDGRWIARLDEALTLAADHVFVTSARLLKRKLKLNPSCSYSPHGVDIEHFHAASDSTVPAAESARKLRHPIIGYFGSIGNWVDVELLTYVARTRPAWTLLLIGLPSTDISDLRTCRNVVLAGPQPYEDLPAWARAFDVAILPYRSSSPLVMHANPLKLREYLATGKPVVATSMPETERFSHCIRVAHNPSEFLQGIETALEQDSQIDSHRRMKEVEGCSWESRVQEIVTVLEPRMVQRRQPARPEWRNCPRLY